MDNLTNFWPLFWGINALHGPSGGGKQEAVNNLLKIAEKEKFFAASISSGDEFRKFFAKTKEVPESQLTPEELDLKKMSTGGYLRTLDLAMPALVDLDAQYFVKRLKGEKAFLAVDGYLRAGGFVDPELKVWIPSQVDQVAEGMLRGLQIALKSGNVSYEEASRYMSKSLYEDVLNYKPTPYKDLKWDGLLTIFSRAVVHEWRHIAIKIPHRDAEALMRFRSQKALWKMTDTLFGKYQETNDSQMGSVLNVLGEGILLQSGRFEVVNGNEILLNPEAEDRSLVGFPNDKTYAQIVDGEMEHIVKSGYSILDLAYDSKKSNLATLVGEINKKYKVFDPELVAELRADDLSNVARWKRLDEFDEKADKTMLRGELGIDLTKSTSEKANVGILENGPDLGKTTYAQLQERAALKAQESYAYMLGEGRSQVETEMVVGERRRV